MNGARTACPDCGSQLPRGLLIGMCPRCALQDAGQAEETADNSRPAKGDGTHRLPRQLGDYELLEEIARGGMGVVYKARQRSLDRFVAVKMLLFGAHANPEYTKRFRVEAAAAAALQHPNIVAIHEVGVHDGEHFLVMDYIDGLNMAKFLKEQSLPARRAVEYLVTIAEAIHYAHQRGILHRDLKPSNVLIDSSGQPRVTDFGLAKRFRIRAGSEKGSFAEPETSTDSLTLPGHVLGSPSYMSPEQARGGKASQRSEVYGLGALLYHLLTGHPPFHARTAIETLRQVIEEQPKHPMTLNGRVDQDLATICAKCLEKEPQRRYPSAEALATDLRHWLNHETISARRAGPMLRFRRWVQRNPSRAALMAMSCAALLVASWAEYSQWVVRSIEGESHKRENREWVQLYEPNSPLQYLHWSSEDLHGFFGEKPRTLPGTIRLFLGVYLENDQQHLVSKFAPLLRYLEESLSSPSNPVRFDLYVFRGRETLEQALTDETRQVHLGRIGEAGLSYLLKDTETGIVPLVQQASGGKVSVVFTRTDTGITNLAGLKGKRFALGSKKSTASGYKFLKLLLDSGLGSRDIDKFKYHEDSEHNVDLVLSREFDAGVTRKEKYNTYTNAALRVLREFPTTSMPWVATKRLAPKLAEKVQEAMTRLEDHTILGNLPENPTNGFASVNAEYFRIVGEDMARVKALFFQDPPTNSVANKQSR